MIFFNEFETEITIVDINSCEEIRMPPTYTIQKQESFWVIFEAYLHLNRSYKIKQMSVAQQKINFDKLDLRENRVT